MVWIKLPRQVAACGATCLSWFRPSGIHSINPGDIPDSSRKVWRSTQQQLRTFGLHPNFPEPPEAAPNISGVGPRWEIMGQSNVKNTAWTTTSWDFHGFSQWIRWNSSQSITLKMAIFTGKMMILGQWKIIIFYSIGKLSTKGSHLREIVRQNLEIESAKIIQESARINDQLQFLRGKQWLNPKNINKWGCP